MAYAKEAAMAKPWRCRLPLHRGSACAVQWQCTANAAMREGAHRHPRRPQDLDVRWDAD